MKNIIHQYYKRIFPDYTVLVQVDPENLKGMELIVFPDGKIKKTRRVFDEEIYDDLQADHFEKANALEFNLYLKGITK